MYRYTSVCSCIHRLMNLWAVSTFVFLFSHLGSDPLHLIKGGIIFRRLYIKNTFSLLCRDILLSFKVALYKHPRNDVLEHRHHRHPISANMQKAEAPVENCLLILSVCVSAYSKWYHHCLVAQDRKLVILFSSHSLFIHLFI